MKKSLMLLIALIGFCATTAFGAELYLYDNFNDPEAGLDGEKWAATVVGSNWSSVSTTEYGSLLLDRRSQYYAMTADPKMAKAEFADSVMFTDESDTFRFAFDMSIDCPSVIGMSSWLNGFYFGSDAISGDMRNGYLSVGQYGNAGNNGALGADAGRFYARDTAITNSDSNSIGQAVRYHYDVTAGLNSQTVSVYEYNAAWEDANIEMYDIEGTLLWTATVDQTFELDTEYAAGFYSSVWVAPETSLSRRAGVFVDNVFTSHVVPEPMSMLTLCLVGGGVVLRHRKR